MHFQVKIPEDGRKNPFRDKQTGKQGFPDVFRCESTYGNGTTAFLDYQNEQPRYTVCI